MMIKKRIVYLLITTLFVGIISCNKADIGGFGNVYLNNGHMSVIKVDTFSAQVSTVYVDSFVTSGKGVSLVGNYTDPAFGNISSQSFFEVISPGYSNTYTYTTFDSLELILLVNKTYYGDTTKNFHIDVSRLSSPIIPPNIANLGTNLYNTDQFSVYPTPIGSTDIIVRPNNTYDTIRIRLDDAIGNEMLGMLQDPNNAPFQSSAAFINYFNGLRLSGNGNNSMILGLKDSAIMRLHYKQSGMFLNNLSLDFHLANKAHHFNNITVDRSSTALKNLSALHEINSQALGHEAYCQYLSNAMIKITFPTITNLQIAPNYANILYAQLVVKPIQESYNTLALPPNLCLATTNGLNQIGLNLTVPGSNGVQYGNLYIDNLYGMNTNYSYDLTSYFKSIINNTTLNTDGLLLIPPSPSLVTNFNRVIIGDSKYGGYSDIQNQNQLVLNVYYLSVQ